MHIKEPLLLVGKSSPCGSIGFPLSLSEWSSTICLTPYNRKQNVLSVSLNKTFPSFFYMHRPTYRISHTTAFVTPVVEHWLEREIAQWAHPMKDRSDDPSHHERMLLPRSYISLLGMRNSSMGPPHEGSIRRSIAQRFEV